MASLNKEQNVFRRMVDKNLKKTNKSIRELTSTQSKELKDIPKEYIAKGNDLTETDVKNIRADVKRANKSALKLTTKAITANLEYATDTIGFGFTYSYSKVSNTYLSYKALTNKDKALSIADKINGKSYIERLIFHSENLNSRTAAIIENGIRLGMSNEQIARNINKQVGINYRHALTISRTETGRVGSIAAERSANNAIDQGLKFNKVWRQYASSSPRHDHSAMEGVTVAQGELFYLPSGSTCQYPRLTGFAGDDINCHCEAIEEFEGFEPTQRRQETEIVDIPNYNVWLRQERWKQ